MLSGIKNRFFFNSLKNPEKNIILTGIPRSGTTLICKLLCELPNVIGLNEPLDSSFFLDRITAVKSIENAFKKFRSSLLKKSSVPIRTRNGKITDNAFSIENNEKREKILKRTNFRFNKILKSDFTLVLKHCAEFSLLIPDLINNYPCYACIRNPLALLGSWNSVQIPVSKGRVAKSRKLLPAFYQEIEIIENLYDKQIFILSWYFEQFENLLPQFILRYEDINKTSGNIVNKIVDTDFSLEWDLQNRNYNELYDKALIIRLAEKLLASNGNYWKFYTKQDVEELLNQYLDAK